MCLATFHIKDLFSSNIKAWKFMKILYSIKQIVQTSIHLSKTFGIYKSSQNFFFCFVSNPFFRLKSAWREIIYRSIIRQKYRNIRNLSKINRGYKKFGVVIEFYVIWDLSANHKKWQYDQVYCKYFFFALLHFYVIPITSSFLYPKKNCFYDLVQLKWIV